VYDKAFKPLKWVLVKAFMFKLLDFDQDFEIHLNIFHVCN
jgi:hypothetical protein